MKHDCGQNAEFLKLKQAHIAITVFQRAILIAASYIHGLFNTLQMSSNEIHVTTTRKDEYLLKQTVLEYLL
jgi:hypothetical protein